MTYHTGLTADQHSHKPAARPPAPIQAPDALDPDPCHSGQGDLAERSAQILRDELGTRPR